MAAADAFAFPSTNEGFGLVALEAMAAGVPVVALDLPVLREVLGDAALYAATVPGLAAQLRVAAGPPDAGRAGTGVAGPSSAPARRPRAGGVTRQRLRA